MKRLLLAASVLAMCALGAVDASAQRPGPRWEGGHATPPPGAWTYSRSHDWCLDKARRLHDFEARARYDRRDVRIVEALRADLRQSCGGGRWNPDRGWYH